MKSSPNILNSNENLWSVVFFCVFFIISICLFSGLSCFIRNLRVKSCIMKLTRMKQRHSRFDDYNYYVYYMLKNHNINAYEIFVRWKNMAFFICRLDSKLKDKRNGNNSIIVARFEWGRMPWSNDSIWFYFVFLKSF